MDAPALTPDPGPRQPCLGSFVTKPGPYRIVHLSDLHIGDERFIPEWADAAAAYVRAARPAVTVITGDLTAGGRPEEYEQARRFIARLQSRSLLIVPGNRDIIDRGNTLFRETFGTHTPTHQDETVIICGIDSNRPIENTGRITGDLARDPRIRIIALHHNPESDPPCPDHAPVDAGRINEICAAAEVDLVLAGHRHAPQVRNRRGTSYVTAGTPTLRRPNCRYFPSFNIIAIDHGTIYVQMADVSGGWGIQTVATRPVHSTVGRTAARTAETTTLLPQPQAV